MPLLQEINSEISFLRDIQPSAVSGIIAKHGQRAADSITVALQTSSVINKSTKTVNRELHLMAEHVGDPVLLFKWCILHSDFSVTVLHFSFTISKKNNCFHCFYNVNPSIGFNV